MPASAKDDHASLLGLALLGTAICAGVIFVISWMIVGFHVAGRYLYITIGLLAAIAYLGTVFWRLSHGGDTLQARMINTVNRSVMLSTARKRLAVISSVAKEASLRVIYWPYELAFAIFDIRAQSAPNIAVRNALALQISSLLPLYAASTMLALNLAMYLLYSIFQFKPGGAFQLMIICSMYITIIWFLDFLVNPVEIQLRQSGSPTDVMYRFVALCVISILAVVILIHTYRLTSGAPTSLVTALIDVLFAGQSNPEVRRVMAAAYERFSAGDLVGSWTALAGMDRSLVVSITVCVLFYLTVGSRVKSLVMGGRSMFVRPEKESEQAANAAVIIGDYALARTYATELPRDHWSQSSIDVVESLSKRQFDKAFASIERLANRMRRSNGLEDAVQLDDREKWLLLGIKVNEMFDRDLELEFARWSIDQPYLQGRDLAKFIATRMISGGVPHVIAFAHYLSATLERTDPRTEWFRTHVISKFFAHYWNAHGHPTIEGGAFEANYADYLASAMHSDKVLHLVGSSPLFKAAPPELDLRAFGPTLGAPSLTEWADPNNFLQVQGADRFYVADALVTIGSVLSQNDNDDARALAQDLQRTKAQLEHAWGERPFDRLGLSDETVSRVAQAFGIHAK